MMRVEGAEALRNVVAAPELPSRKLRMATNAVAAVLVGICMMKLTLTLAAASTSCTEEVSTLSTCANAAFKLASAGDPAE